MDEVLISLIVPTRGRPEGMLSFLETVCAHASNAQNIEVVMVVDEDDPQSHAITFKGLSLVRVVVPPGLNMGALNMAGYRASRGKYIMLTNDDVRVRTPAWDDKILAVFSSFPDGIVLVHVNDTTQKDNLCVFPCVSRRFCELTDGICPEEYIRYCIDDHVHHVFELLARLGHKRIVYMPDVVFEHLNVVINAAGQRACVPHPKIHEKDTLLFYETTRSRKELAIRVAAWIEAERRNRQVDETRPNVLAPRGDSASSDRPEFARFMSEGNPILQRMPPYVEREIGRLFCILGFSRIGTSLWNRARDRKALTRPQPVLVDPDRCGFAVFLYEHKYFFLSAIQLAALGGELNAHQCQAGAISNMQVAQSLAEASALIARLKKAPATNSQAAV